ncbi:MAG: hypothetical protein GEU78_10410 [Actinobacteria bacterium]|nr:hypothetical protein [Actinomycetota bacterium]
MNDARWPKVEITGPIEGTAPEPHRPSMDELIRITAAEQRATKAEAEAEAATKRAEAAEIERDTCWQRRTETEVKLVAAERQLTEAQAEAAGLRDALRWAMGNLRSGLNEWCGDHAYHKARAAISATGPSPYAEVVRVARLWAIARASHGDLAKAVSALNPKAGEK